MSPKQTRDPETVHAPLGPYAHQVELTGAHRSLVVAGQIGIAPDGGVSDDVAVQLDVALGNVIRNLEAAEMTAADLVKLNLFLVEEVAAPVRAEILARHLGGHRPAMTLVFVPRLAAPHLKVEIEAWAAADEPRDR
jgi:enamine deaminase RidA (YjgF/YER057c/UK114 family)